jgi:hypothetical protein
MAFRISYPILLLTLCALSGKPAAGEWMPLEERYQEPGLHTVYVEPDTLRREGDLVTVWHLTDYKMMQGNVGFAGGSHRFLSTKTHTQFDCAKKRARLLAYEEFSGHMGTGRRDDGLVDRSRWVPVKPDSLNHALWLLVCARPAQSGSCAPVAPTHPSCVEEAAIVN